MVFTAYDKFHYTQFDAYQDYALLTPGTPEAAKVAYSMPDNPEDETLHTLNAALWSEQLKEEHIVAEYRMFVVRAADGVLFDIYILDEDQIFCCAVTGVAEEDVFDFGVMLMSSDEVEAGRTASIKRMHNLK